ncbi:MAG TPA: hypothetical protein ENI87_08210 [bacterium]|nr:hypothetical protein [bacterium]
MIDFNSDTAFTQHALDAMTERTRAAIKNIANQNVEGFKRYEVRFEDLLREAVQEGRSEGSVEPVLRRDESGPPGQNNVVLMEELAVLGKAQIMHDYMLRRAAGYFSHIKRAINGR